MKVSVGSMMSKPDPTFQVTLSGTPTSNSALPQPRVMPGPGQVTPLPQGENQEQADQEIYIMILPGIQGPQEKKLKTEEQDRSTRLLRTNPSNSILSRPKTRVAAKRGHTASSASGIPGRGGGGILGAINENVINTHCYPAGVLLTRPAEGKKALQTLQAVSTHSGASLITPHSQKSGAEQAPHKAAVQALAARTLGPTQQQVSVSAVSVPDSPSSELSTPHSVGFQSPVAASTPLLHCKRLALRPLAAETCAQDSPGNNFRPVSTSSSSDLQQDCAQPVLSLDHFSSPILPWSDVSTSQAPSVNTAKSVSTSTPVSKTKRSHLISTAQPEASVLNLSSSVNSEELLGTLFTHESAETPSSSQLPTFPQSSTKRHPAPSMEFQHDEAQDSGIGASLGSVAHTSGSTGVESDFGATCSSWATSEDSNQMVIDFNVDSLSQGSTEDNSNSQGDDGEMNTSLTKMYWLNDFALKKKRSGSENLLSPDVPTIRRLESRHNKNLCVCGAGRRVESEFDKKPPYRYKHLIEMALLSRKDRTMTSREIRMWFVQNFPFFKRHEKCGFWQNAIQHNLSSNDCFVKNKIKKRHWTLDLSLSIGTEENLTDSMPVSVPIRVPLPVPLPAGPMTVRSAVPGPVMPETVMLQSLAQPMMISSGLPATSPAAAPCNEYGFSTGRMAFQPILPRPLMPNQIALLNVNNLPPSYLQQHPSLLLHIPPSPAENPTLPNAVYPISSVAMAAPVPKLPLPPLSAAVSSATSSTSSTKKSSAGAGAKAKPGRQGARGGRRKMRKTKSSGACSENNVLVQAAIQSGLRKQAPELSQRVGGWGSDAASSVHASPDADPGPGNAVLANSCRGSGGRGKSPLVRSASLPPILSKRVKVSHLNMPVEEPVSQRTNLGQPHISVPLDEPVVLERRGCGQPRPGLPLDEAASLEGAGSGQLRRGRRKQNFPASGNASSDMIISNAGLEDGSNCDILCQADSGEPAANNSLSLAGPQAGPLQLSPLVTPPRGNPKLSQALVDSSPSGLSLTLDTSTPIKQPKIRMEPLPSPIGDPAAMLVHPSPMDNSLMDMLDGFGFPGETLFSARKNSTPGGDFGAEQKGRGVDVTDGNLLGLTTPPSACLKTSQNWSMKSFGDNSLGLLATPGAMDLGVSSFSHLLDFPDDLSMADQSPEGTKSMSCGPQSSAASQLFQSAAVDIQMLDDQQCSTTRQASYDHHSHQQQSALQQAGCGQQDGEGNQEASSGQQVSQQQSSQCHQQLGTVQQAGNNQRSQQYHLQQQSRNNLHNQQQFCDLRHPSNGQCENQQQICVGQQYHIPEQASDNPHSHQHFGTVRQAGNSQQYDIPGQASDKQHSHQQFMAGQLASNIQHSKQQYNIPEQACDNRHNHQQFSTVQQASDSQHDLPPLQQQHSTELPKSSGQHSCQQISITQHSSCGQCDVQQQQNVVLQASSHNSFQQENQQPHTITRDGQSPCSDPQPQVSSDMKAMQETYASSHRPVSRANLSRNLFPQSEPPAEVGSSQGAQQPAPAQPTQPTPPSVLAQPAQQPQLTQQAEATEQAQAQLPYQVQRTLSNPLAQQSQLTKWMQLSHQPRPVSHTKLERQSPVVCQVQVIQPAEQPEHPQQVQVIHQTPLIRQTPQALPQLVSETQQTQPSPFAHQPQQTQPSPFAHQPQQTQPSPFAHQPQQTQPSQFAQQPQQTQPSQFAQQAQQSRLLHRGQLAQDNQQSQLAHWTQQHQLAHQSQHANQTQHAHQTQNAQQTQHASQTQQAEQIQHDHPIQHAQWTRHAQQIQHALETQHTQQYPRVQQSRHAHQAGLAQHAQFTQSLMAGQPGINSPIPTQTEGSLQSDVQGVCVVRSPQPASAAQSGLNPVQRGIVSMRCRSAPGVPSKEAGAQQAVPSSPRHSPGAGQLPCSSQGSAPSSSVHHSAVILANSPTACGSQGSTSHRAEVTAARGDSNVKQFGTAETAQGNHSRMEVKGNWHTDFMGVEDKEGFETDGNVGVRCSSFLTHSSRSLATSKLADAMHSSGSADASCRVHGGASPQERTTVADGKPSTMPNFFDLSFEPPSFADHQFSMNDSFLAQHASDGASQHTASESAQSSTNQNVLVQDYKRNAFVANLSSSITTRDPSAPRQNPGCLDQTAGPSSCDFVGIAHRAVRVSGESVAVLNQSTDLQQHLAAYQSLDAAQRVSSSPSGSNYMSAFFDSLINTPPSKQGPQQYYGSSYPSTAHFSAHR